MKRILSINLFLATLLAIAVYPAMQVNAQNYLITFDGTGASSSVSTVEVENLSTGETLTLNGSDILHLQSTVGISHFEKANSSVMKIYPNPMLENSIVELRPPVKGDAIITIYEMTGKSITQVREYLGNSSQQFRVSGLNKGVYLINVTGSGYQFSGKILSNGQKSGNPGIEKVSGISDPPEEKIAKKNSDEVSSTIDMEYTTGERLKFTATSGNFSTVKTDIPNSNKKLTFNFVPCTDGDNNNYAVVTIGKQIWMAENLKSTKYNSGTSIPLVTGNSGWMNLTTPAYCWYNNDESANKDANGALYNWFTVNTRELAPTGWHVPTDEEWKTLEIYLGMTQEQADASGPRGTDQGTQLKSTNGWISGGIGNGTNSSGFTGLPSGYRTLEGGGFDGIGNTTCWWSSTEFFADGAIGRHMWLEQTTIRRRADELYVGKINGYSVRCLHDSLPAVTTSSISIIATTSATTGGTIISEGNSAITACGVCWSINENPTTDDSITIDAIDNTNFISLLTGLTEDTKYYVRAYASNSEGTSYGTELSFTTAAAAPTLAIGDSHQGGIIAYIFQPGNPGYIEGETHGLIAAPAATIITGILWYNGSNTNTGATATALGTGNANTNAIVASQGDGNYAASLCYNLETGGYSDWYLPSKDELHLLYLSRAAIGGSVSVNYWSSTELSLESAWKESFVEGYKSASLKYDYYYVRAVRSF